MPSFSIAVCTHNPDQRLLKRLLYSIQSLQNLDEVELILIVDNNSSPPLSESPDLKRFLGELPQARLICESHPGLAAARCRAIEETSSDILLFFDDDNEPSSEYLRILHAAFQNYPWVAIWGPGTIKVEFLDPTPLDIRRNAEVFQERERPFGYVCTPATWNEQCPNGTGMAIRRVVLDSYYTSVRSGLLRTSGRLGESLMSAEDVQMVWEAFKLGFGAGMIPALVCGHLIPRRKANLSYIRRLAFGTSSSFFPALKESFPESLHLSPQRASILWLSKMILIYCLDIMLRPRLRVEVSRRFGGALGYAYGRGIVFSDPSSKLIHRAATWFGYL